jgi:aquaporin related protein
VSHADTLSEGTLRKNQPPFLLFFPRQAFLTSTLVLTVLLLAAEKHKSTFLAPIGIGLVLLVCHLFGVVWTGCGMNPARAFGPSVVSGVFPTYHWIYWLGPMLGSLMAVSFYLLLKVSRYQEVDHIIASALPIQILS